MRRQLDRNKEPRDTKSEMVYDALYGKIISGEIPAETKLNVSQIARDFKVSQIPVREALNRLDSDGVLDYVPYCGYIVPSFSIDELHDTWEVKVSLELLAAKLAAMEYRPEDLVLLEQNVQRTKELIERKDFDKFFLLNKDFHMTLYSFSGNRLLCSLIRKFWDRTEKVRGPYPFTEEHVLHSIGEHEEMIEALKARDGAKVQEIIRRQREKNWRLFSQLYRNFKNIF